MNVQNTVTFVLVKAATKVNVQHFFINNLSYYFIVILTITAVLNIFLMS